MLHFFRDELNQIMESQGAVNPGILVLTVSLSKPFRRLEKYSGMLLELERHIEENHVDRGDTQRSISIYKEIAVCCLLFFLKIKEIKDDIIICCSYCFKCYIYTKNVPCS